MSREGNEGFYLENGQKQDAAIHNEILAGVDDTADRMTAFQRAVQRGIDPETAARVYQVPGAFDLGPPESLR